MVKVTIKRRNRDHQIVLVTEYHAHDCLTRGIYKDTISDMFMWAAESYENDDLIACIETMNGSVTLYGWTVCSYPDIDFYYGTSMYYNKIIRHMNIAC